MCQATISTYLVCRYRLGGFGNHAECKGAKEISILVCLRPVLLNQGTHHDIPEFVLAFLGEGLS